MEQTPYLKLDDIELPIFKTFCSEVDVNRPKKIMLSQGAKSKVLQKIEATSISKNNVGWSFNTPSSKIGIGRQFYVDFIIEGRVLDQDGDPLLDINLGTAYLNSRFGLRPMAFQSTADLAQFDINGVNLSWCPRQTINALYSYDTNINDWNGYYSTSGSLQEQFSTYNASPDPIGSFAVETTSIRNPLSYYGNYIYQTSRGITNYSLATGAVNSGLFRIIFSEPLYLPPLTSGSRNEPCLFGINNINLNYSIGDLSRIFSVADLSTGVPGVFGSVDNVKIIQATLHVEYYTFNILYQLPKTPVWNCQQIINFKKPFDDVINDCIYTTFEGGGDTPLPNAIIALESLIQIQTDLIILNQIPKKIYIYAKRSINNDNPGTTETFMRIKNINISWCNKTGLLSSCNELDLYALSVQNGYNRSYTEMTHVGLPLCIKPDRDFNLENCEAPGLIGGQYSFQADILFSTTESWSNNTVGTLPARYPITNFFDVIVTVENQGVLWIGPDGLLKVKYGLFSEKTIIESEIKYSHKKTFGEIGLSGGSILNTIGNVLENVGKTFVSALGFDVGPKKPTMRTYDSSNTPVIGVNKAKLRSIQEKINKN